MPLDGNANGHSEQFKHSCIVQPGRCGFHCNKSNVTALGGGPGTVTVSTSFTRLSEGISIEQKDADTQIQIWVLEIVSVKKTTGYLLQPV